MKRKEAILEARVEVLRLNLENYIRSVLNLRRTAVRAEISQQWQRGELQDRLNNAKE